MKVSPLLGGERAPSDRPLTRTPAVRPPETRPSGVTISLAAPLTYLWATDIPERETRERPLTRIHSDCLNCGSRRVEVSHGNRHRPDEVYLEGTVRTSESRPLSPPKPTRAPDTLQL